ncbi:TetR/AcrR family transcriptional regulator [Streptomyces sp. MN03-5084-2B]|nr:TetR/AcrR family transcriptional regulator [Streptomyces sp. MN03-5084-2B]
MASTRVPRRRSETRARLLAAGRQLLLEQGLTQVSIDAVTERAGYTRGAFYSNFGSMDELIFAVYGQHMAGVLATLDSVGERLAGAPAPATLEQAVAAVLEALPFDVNWLDIRVGFAAQAGRNPELADLLAAQDRQLRDGLEPALLRIMAATGRRLTVDGSEFTQAMLAAHDGALAHSATTPDPHRLRTTLCAAVFSAMTVQARS